MKEMYHKMSNIFLVVAGSGFHKCDFFFLCRCPGVGVKMREVTISEIVGKYFSGVTTEDF